ncbi:MAG: hypothetical protein ACK54E_20215 [Pseudanabaena sp.]|nr:hypothetical protein [Pseudanabaena sp. M176S2SP2A07QC]MCA6540236.1 hypothetical protein [Pseudanabaena sp. M037S2SP2A07QC]MCA6565177.1 hypothetical protein [Pseudanabaena sp. M151S2SP2A07QC]MCA6577420.1 hypothetical protein [Pseudanabaena sp. M085S1SP2A07QC]
MGVAEDGLVRCGVNGQHHYSGHLGVCPWCERAAKLGGRDPFPALGVISSGQHLKPAAISKAVGKPILKPNPKTPTSISTNPILHRSVSTSSVNNITSLSTSTSSSVNLPQSIQGNYINNQTLRKITLWEALLNSTVSLRENCTFLFIPSWLCISLSLLMLFIVVDIDIIWRVSFVGVFFFAFVASVYVIFIKKTFRIASGFSTRLQGL